MSDTHSRSGPVTAKLRATRSGAGAALGSRTVVVTKRLRRTPCPQARGTHQPRHALAGDATAVFPHQFGVDAWRAVCLARASMDRMDLGAERDVGRAARRRRSLAPRVEATDRDLQNSARDRRRIGGLVRCHEPEDFFEFGTVSCANQAAALERISRSSLSWRFSRRSRTSSSRSNEVGPSLRRPPSRSACATQLWIDWAVGSSFRDSYSGVRPARTNSAICCRNSGGYGLRNFGIVDSFGQESQGSTKAGQVHL